MSAAYTSGMIERAEGEASGEDGPRNPLTATECEIVALLATGRNASEVARLTGRSVHTVRTHIRNIAQKLETHGRSELLARARQFVVTAAQTLPRLQP